MKKPSVSVILPTYNELGNIVQLIKEVINYTKGYVTEIIVVDDNSPDKTSEAIIKNFGNTSKVRLFVRRKERGLASAIKTGIIKSTKNCLLIMDTDFNHDPKEIPQMLKKINQHTLVIGSRYVKNGGMENKIRHWLSYMFNIYLKILLGHNVNDNLSGYFLIYKKDLISLKIETIFYGFGDFFIRLIYRAYRNNFRFIEIPVFYKNRTYGISKSKFISMFITYTQSALKLRLQGL